MGRFGLGYEWRDFVLYEKRNGWEGKERKGREGKGYQGRLMSGRVWANVSGSTGLAQHSQSMSRLTFV